MFDFIFGVKSKTITISAVILGVSSTVSALLGIIRDRLLAGTFGAGPELDVYFAAFRIPNFVYGVLITGGLMAAFIPVFSETFENDEEEGWELASNLLNFLVLALSGLAFLLFIFAPLVVQMIAPGFSEAQTEWTIILTRIMMISPILLGVSSLFSGVLKYFDHFLTYALAPILYNLGIIFGIVFLVPVFDLLGLAYGVVLGALAHLLIQLPAATKIGFNYKPVLDITSKRLRRIVYLIIPRMVGQASSQINLVVITAIASTLASGSLSIFNFANHLQAFPIRVIGVSFAVAAFPRFSKDLANGEKKKFLIDFSNSARKILFAIIPISFLTFILRGQVVRLVLGSGRFGWEDTRLTAASLGIFAFSLFANALNHLLIRAYFALQDTKTPVYISIGGVLVNVTLAFLFVFLLGSIGPVNSAITYFLRLDNIENIKVLAFPLAFFFSTFLQLIALYHILEKRIGDLKRKEITDSAIKILGSSIVMVITAFFTLRIVVSFIALDTFLAVFLQAAITTVVSGIVYLLAAFAFDSPEVKSIIKKLL
ncbi:MAG: murein biosynthesis integral membrane protein MurJ [Patescibacteria group bacterium]